MSEGNNTRCNGLCSIAAQPAYTCFFGQDLLQLAKVDSRFEMAV